MGNASPPGPKMATAAPSFTSFVPAFKSKKKRNSKENSPVSLYFYQGGKFLPEAAQNIIGLLFLIGQSRVTYVMCYGLVQSAPSHNTFLESPLNCRSWGSKKCISQPPCM